MDRRAESLSTPYVPSLLLPAAVLADHSKPRAGGRGDGWEMKRRVRGRADDGESESRITTCAHALSEPPSPTHRPGHPPVVSNDQRGLPPEREEAEKAE